MNVLVISFFNSSNIGDVAIADTIIEELCLHSIIRMDISGRKAANNQMATILSTPQPKARFYDIKCFLSLFRARRVDYLKSVISQTDYVLFAGGNMMMDTDAYPGYSVLCNRFARIIKKNKKRYGFAFVGVGPTQNRFQNLLWKKVAEGAEFISVRDSFSQSYLKNVIGVRKEIKIWQDPVLGLDNKHYCETNARVAVNIFTNCKNNEREMVVFYTNLIKALAPKMEVVLFTTEQQDTFGMNIVYEEVKNLPNVSKAIVTTYDQLIKFYNTADFLVSTRMHSLIIGLTQGMPAAALSWQGKIDGMMHDLGLSDWVYNAMDIRNNAEEIIDTICLRIDSIEQQKERLAEVQKILHGRHRSNFSALEKELAKQ